MNKTSTDFENNLHTAFSYKICINISINCLEQFTYFLREACFVEIEKFQTGQNNAMQNNIFYILLTVCVRINPEQTTVMTFHNIVNW